MSSEDIARVESIVRRQNGWRLGETINLIASENVLSARARALLSSDFNHRYAEGHPGARYYEGTEQIDLIEAEVRERLGRLFGYSKVECRTISGTNANDVIFASFVKETDAVVVNSLPVGGHISHQLFGGMGKYTRNIFHFPRAANGYQIDVAASKDFLREKKPKIVVFGKSLILFPEPVKELAPVAHELGATVIYDGAHVLGLIAGKQFQDPVSEGADILMGSTHKTFPGPQRGVLMGNLPDDRWKPVDRMAFPGTLSNHHLMTLPPLLVTTIEMEEFGRAYATQVVANAKHFAGALQKAGFSVECADLGFTQSHQVAVNVRAYGGGGKAAEGLTKNDIIVNRNLLPHDPPKQVNNPSGLRLGVQEMTRWGMKAPEMEEIAGLMKACVIDGKSVKDEVHRLKGRFTSVHFSHDRPAASKPESVAADPLDMDMAGY
ncbi:MAG TPA: serine hydroxymethyltransferase [Planctomycetota bacterium]|nr:serine hydroxymethyltransferase [Planctomycetota bacterium]